MKQTIMLTGWRAQRYWELTHDLAPKLKELKEQKQKEGEKK